MADAFDEMTPEALLRRTAWLDSLARELVADPHRAQDAVQDAWVAALQQRALVARLGPWLGQVVRRLAARQRRREAGRRSREAAAARPEAEPSAHDVVVRVQQQHRVVAAVLGLYEPYRQTVLMRFFDGLPPRAIAAAMAVPVATVHTRLRRALERLRTVLDDSSGGRRAWSGALATGLAMPHGVTALLSGTLMKTKLACAAAAAAGLLLGAFYLLDPARPPEPTQRAGDAVAAQTAELPTTARTTPGERVADAPVERPPVAADPGAVLAPDALQPLTGVVVDAAARPIAGALVVADEPLGAGFNLLAESQETEERARQTTGADGRFTLRVPFARVLRVVASADGFAPRFVEPCYGGQDLTLALQRGASLIASVRDAATGEPVAEVALQGWLVGATTQRLEGRTGNDGTVRVDGLLPGTWSVDVVPTDHENQLRQKVAVRAGETARLDVALQRGGTVSGTVTDATTGLPIAGAEISAGWTFEKVVRTDAAGNYRMRGAPGPGVPDMNARAPGYALASQDVQGSGEQRVDFVLHRGSAIVGRIVDATGAPVAGVYVAAVADLGVTNGMGHTDWQYARSGDDGRFRVERLAPGGEYTLLVRRRGIATKAFLLPPVDPDRAIDVGDLRLEAPAVLLGRVVDTAGRGIAGANVDLRGTNDDLARLLAGAEPGSRRVPYHAESRDATTDADGWFRFADLAGGTYDLDVRVKSGPEAERGDVRVEPGVTTSGVEIVLDLGRTIAGTVTTDDGSPLPDEMTSVSIDGPAPDGSTSRWVMVGADGAFRAVGLADGRYHVTTSVSRWANDEPPIWIGSTVDDVAAGREDVRLVLRRAAFIAGRVVDSLGRPCKGIAVEAVAAAGQDSARDVTDDDGAFRLSVLPGTVCDLRYGAMPAGSPVEMPHARTAKSYPGVRAGTIGLVLPLDPPGANDGPAQKR